MDLTAALSLCRELGLQEYVVRSRFVHYGEILDSLISALASGGQQAALDRFERDKLPSFVALSEIAELTQVLPFLRVCELRVARGKLLHALQGPVLPIDEDENSNQGRNILFELNVAAKLWNAGLAPRLGDSPDLACTVSNRDIYLECKRPLSRAGASRALQASGRQLRRALHAGSAGARGVVALSVTRLLNPGDQLFVHRDEASGKAALSEHLSTIASSLSSSLMELSEVAIGVLWHAITPGVDQQQNLVVAAQHMKVDALAPPGSEDERLFFKVYQALRRGWNATAASAS